MGITGLMLASRYQVLPGEPTTTSERMEIMRALMQTGENSYRQLTDHTEGFLDYFYETTPVSEIGLLNIGSRPSHRKKGDRSKTSVRAIGWVFGWAQARHTLPAWYGIGAALEQWINNDPVRLNAVDALIKELNESIRILHGEVKAHIGSFGNQERVSYTAFFPDFDKYLLKLASLNNGEQLSTH